MTHAFTLTPVEPESRSPGRPTIARPKVLAPKTLFGKVNRRPDSIIPLVTVEPNGVPSQKTAKEGDLATTTLEGQPDSILPLVTAEPNGIPLPDTTEESEGWQEQISIISVSSPDMRASLTP